MDDPWSWTRPLRVLLLPRMYQGPNLLEGRTTPFVCDLVRHPWVPLSMGSDLPKVLLPGRLDPRLPVHPSSSPVVLVSGTPPSVGVS